MLQVPGGTALECEMIDRIAEVPQMLGKESSPRSLSDNLTWSRMGIDPSMGLFDLPVQYPPCTSVQKVHLFYPPVHCIVHNGE